MRGLVSILGICLAVSAARAEQRVVSTELVTLSLGGGVPEYFLRTEGKVVSLLATPRGISAPLPYRGSGTLALFAKRSDATPTAGEEAPKPALQVQLPSGHNRVLLVFSPPAPKDRKRPAVQALGISTGSLREGDYRVFNFSRQPVYAILNEKKATVRPGKTVDLSAPSWRRETLDMEVKLGLQKEGRVQVVYSSVWGHRPARRMFLFILDRPDKFRPLDIRRFSDTPGVRAEREGRDR